MNDALLNFAVGFAVGAAGKFLVSFWKKESPRIEAALDHADDILEARLGIDLPDSAQAAWHEIVHGAVAYANKFASDGRFWREVVRAILAKDASKAVLLQQELAGLTWDRGIAAVEAMMSPELKSITNEVKEILAAKVAKANCISAGMVPAEEPVIRQAIRAVAPAHKPLEGPPTKELIERLILESQERQRALAAK